MTHQTSSPITVMVIDDDRFAREAICRMIDDPQIKVVNPDDNDEHSSGEQYLELIKQESPQVVIADIHASDDMAGDEMKGPVQLIRDIVNVSPATSCLVLAASDPDGERLVEALLAGARGCVRKGSVPRKGLAQLVKRIAAGEYVLDRRVASSVMRRHLAHELPDRNVHRLSDREQAFLRLNALGMSTEEIAEELGVGEAVAQTIIGNIVLRIHRGGAMWSRAGQPTVTEHGVESEEEMAPWPTANTLA